MEMDPGKKILEFPEKADAAHWEVGFTEEQKSVLLTNVALSTDDTGQFVVFHASQLYVALMETPQEYN